MIMKKIIVQISFIIISSYFCSCGADSAQDPTTENSWETVEEVIEESVEESAEETVEESAEETVEEFAEETVEESTEETVEESTAESVEELPEEVIEEPISPSIQTNDYKVILSVDSTINMNESGMLHVWIGDTGVTVSISEGMVTDATTIPTDIGKYAKITPVAPNFEIESLTNNECHKIHPSGSEVRFILKAKSTGTYKVSANIELYEGVDCTGTSVPKTSETLSVIVQVNTKKEISKKMLSLGDIVWEKFLSFWGALTTLLFAAVLFLIRKKIKNKTGFDEKPE